MDRQEPSEHLECRLMQQQCTSTFDRWRCEKTDDHVGDHEWQDEAERVIWNTRATGKSIRRPWK